MKIPFPHDLAAEFVLFRESAKFTLPHLLTGVSGAIAVAACLVVGVQRLGLDLGATAAAALITGVVTGYLVFRLFGLMLPALRMLVKLGWMAVPDRQRLRGKIHDYCGWRVGP